MARDIIHYAVKNALIKDKWKITHDPYAIEFEDELLYADLAAERTIAAERDGQKIIIEVKSFIGRSTIQDFKLALGQYILYEQLLAVIAPNYKLYLAVSDNTYAFDFQRRIIQFMIQRNQIPLIIVNINREEIVKWIN